MGKGVSWHNTQFCDLKNTKAIRQDRWKPITNGKRNSTPAIPILTPAGASTISTLLSRRAGTTTEATLDGITPFNAGKKKEEALSLLKKWFPQMENFSGQLKKYKVTISDLLAENEQLEAKAKASEKGKMKDTMERAKLESELKDIQRLVDRIPPEVLAELKRQQRHTRER